MLILLPPSETKDFGSNRSRLALPKLSFPELLPQRQKTLAALIALSKTPKNAVKVLGISNQQSIELEYNAQLLTAPTSAAIEIYSGVLFDALSYETLNKSARQKADETIAITSALFGLLRPQDSIPHYRLSGDTVLPKIGGVSKGWKEPTSVVIERMNPSFILDMRPGIYAKFWQPNVELARKTLVVKIMTKVGTGKDSKKIAISHNNKLTKGQLVREMVKMKKFPSNSNELIQSLRALKWDCELTKSENGSDLLEVFV